MKIKQCTPTQAARVVLLSVAVLVVNSCAGGVRLPERSSREWNEAVRAFYVGLAALQVGDDVRADSKLAELTRMVPGEPAGWGNWSMLALRQRNFEPAAERLGRARDLAPENDQIYYLIGLLEKARGRSPEAITALRKAIGLNGKNLIAIFALAEEVERQGDDNSAAEYQRLVQ
jgi:tetratricopeptide (TPR) repeat protein